MSQGRGRSDGVLDAVHEAFLAAPDEPLPDVVRDVVAQSWRRSLHFGVDPLAPAPLAMGEDELRAYREAHPLAPLMPLVRSLLAEDAEDAGHIVAVGDAHGRLLWVEGHHGLRTRAESMHFVEGALWSEGGMGTNAPGTALALSAPVQIAAAEHFGMSVHPWSCVASPVRDPRTGELLGVIDLTGGDDVVGPRSLALVRACAAAMEAQLVVLPGSSSQRPSSPRPAASARTAASAPRLDLLGSDSGVLHLPDRSVRLSRRHSEILWLLATHPGGLSTEGIDARLNAGASQLVTVRAEMVRLRRVLGDDVLASRPYRLTLPVTTDVEELRRLLARGAVLKALDAFPGPPLPLSQAPAVVAAREELLAELRQAVLRSRSAAALERWTASPSGHDDAGAWQALFTCLPYGSPKRATAKAHLARLAG